MSRLVDTSVLVRQVDPSSLQHPAALDALDALRDQAQTLHVFEQNMIEFWAVATRPRSVNGLGLSTSEANNERLRLETLFTLLPDPPDLSARWVQVVNQFGVSGKPTHDARIVAAMLAHGMTHILTFNVRDFQRYASLGIVAVDPATVPQVTTTEESE